MVDSKPQFHADKFTSWKKCNGINVWLNIVLRTHAPRSAGDGAESSSVVVNIEVDGLRHRRVKKKRFDLLRDAFLQPQGIIVKRIESSVVSAMNEAQLEQFVQGVAVDALADHLKAVQHCPRWRAINQLSSQMFKCNFDASRWCRNAEVPAAGVQ